MVILVLYITVSNSHYFWKWCVDRAVNFVCSWVEGLLYVKLLLSILNIAKFEMQAENRTKMVPFKIPKSETWYPKVCGHKYVILGCNLKNCYHLMQNNQNQYNSGWPLYHSQGRYWLLLKCCSDISLPCKAGTCPPEKDLTLSNSFDPIGWLTSTQ